MGVGDRPVTGLECRREHANVLPLPGRHRFDDLMQGEVGFRKVSPIGGRHEADHRTCNPVAEPVYPAHGCSPEVVAASPDVRSPVI